MTTLINKKKHFFFCRVRNWALKFGVDLWEFGRQFTKMTEIRNVSFSLILSTANKKKSKNPMRDHLNYHKSVSCFFVSPSYFTKL